MIIRILFLILIVLILILFIPARVEFVFHDGKLEFCIKALFFEYKRKENSSKKGKKKKQPPSNDESEEALFSDKLIKMQENLGRFADLYSTTVRLTKKYLNVKEFSADISVGTGDAATTAISVGALWGVVYSFVAALGLFVYIDNPKVSITPNYNEREFKSNARCIISARIVYIIIIMISIFIKHKTGRRKKNERTSNQ